MYLTGSDQEELESGGESLKEPKPEDTDTNQTELKSHENANWRLYHYKGDDDQIENRRGIRSRKRSESLVNDKSSLKKISEIQNDRVKSDRFPVHPQNNEFKERMGSLDQNKTISKHNIMCPEESSNKSLQEEDRKSKFEIGLKFGNQKMCIDIGADTDSKKLSMQLAERYGLSQEQSKRVFSKMVSMFDSFRKGLEQPKAVSGRSGSHNPSEGQTQR